MTRTDYEVEEIDRVKCEMSTGEVTKCDVDEMGGREETLLANLKLHFVDVDDNTIFIGEITKCINIKKTTTVNLHFYLSAHVSF